MACSKKFAKAILMIINIGFFLLGAGALTLGLFLLVDNDKVLHIVGKIPGTDVEDVDSVLSSVSYLENCSYILIAAGSFVFIIATCGLCGGALENKVLLYIYSVCVFVIMALQITVAVLGFIYKDRAAIKLQSWFRNLINLKYEGATLNDDNLPVLASDKSGISDVIDMIQVSLKCCGVTHFTDFETATKWSGEYNITNGNESISINAAVPLSCCKINNPSRWPSSLSEIVFQDVDACLQNPVEANANMDACYEKVIHLVTKYSEYAIGVAITVGFLELFGIIAACIIIHKKELSHKVIQSA